MKKTWKERLAEKDKTLKNVKATQNNIRDQIYDSENEHVGLDDTYSNNYYNSRV
jgi:hypothetical protein